MTEQRKNKANKGIYFGGEDAIERIQNLIRMGNRRLVVLERGGSILIRMPVSLAVVIVTAMAIFALPLLIVLAVLGLFLRFNLYLTDNVA